MREILNSLREWFGTVADYILGNLLMDDGSLLPLSLMPAGQILRFVVGVIVAALVVWAISKRKNRITKPAIAWGIFALFLVVLIFPLILFFLFLLALGLSG